MPAQLKLFEIESLANEVRSRAKAPPDEPVPATVIARRVLGRKSVLSIPRFGYAGLLARVDDEYRIVVRSGEADANFIVAHELGHWVLRHVARFDGTIEQEEDAANKVAAAILAPRQAILVALSRWDEDHERMADAFGATQSMVALRVGEIIEDERALISKETVRIRTAGRFEWPDEHTVRGWARRPPKEFKPIPLKKGYDRGRTLIKRTG